MVSKSLKYNVIGKWGRIVVLVLLLTHLSLVIFLRGVSVKHYPFCKLVA